MSLHVGFERERRTRMLWMSLRASLVPLFACNSERQLVPLTRMYFQHGAERHT